MRSSSGGAGALVAGGCALLAALSIGYLRPRLAARFHEVRVTTDTYALPPPEQAVVASLGYRSAFADLIYAETLVAYGLHFQEHRRFEFVGDYLDTVNTLDPHFAVPYYFADTLLTLGPVKPRYEDYVHARRILERGMKELPGDAQLADTAGEFMAYLATSSLKSDAEKSEWRLAGAQALGRACALAGSDSNIPYHCITAATLLSNAGQREAMIAFLQRLLAVSDDPEIRRMALGYIKQKVGEQERDEAQQRFLRFHEVWGKDLAFVSRNTLLSIGPPMDPARCAGPDQAFSKDCATTWADWAAQHDLKGTAPQP